jgi:endonuclease/exonuclease/phosphatase family metal-dependent hydrolase
VATFKIMTWNVENLFRPSPGAPAEDQQRFQDKLTLLSVVITQLAPDVVALQEVGGDEPLLDLQEALGAGYPHRRASNFPDQRGIRVAFLSQLPLESATDFEDFPPGPALDIHDLTPSGGSEPLTHMGRGALQVDVTKNGRTFTVITTHLKSKLLTFPSSGGAPRFTPRDENERAQVAGIALMRRMAEAVTLRIHANAILTGNDQRPLLVLGDFNDVPDAQTSLILNGPSGSEIGTGGFDRRDKGDDVRLFNLGLAIPLERRFSRVHQGRGELLDQIFVSEELLPIDASNHRQLPVVDSHIDFVDQLPSIGDNPLDRAKAVAPDHAPVTADFTF